MLAPWLACCHPLWLCGCCVLVWTASLPASDWLRSDGERAGACRIMPDLACGGPDLVTCGGGLQ